MRRALLLVAITAATVALGEDKQTTMGEDAVGCKTTDDTYEFYKLFKQDRQAGAVFGVQHGCKMLKAGTTVWITDRAPLSGMTGVRPQGDPNSYYVVTSAVK